MRISNILSQILFVTLICLFVACKNDNSNDAIFQRLGSDLTNVDFINSLPVELDLNILNYMYYYNGGGLAAADLNNDNLVDLIFSSNLEEEAIYINKGEMQFEKLSPEFGFDGGPNGWSTGVTIVDINSDGLMDIYLSQVGTYRNLNNRNKLFICQNINENGLPTYREEAEAYNLDFAGFSTHAGFFDYDLDGDLDMYLMNHSLHHNGTFGKRSNFLNTIDSISGDKLFRNDNKVFTDVTKEAGIQSIVIGYGLGLAFGDVNLDGYPDIYIGNDFHENDYLYINNGDGTFSDDLTNQMQHTSRFSMGVDIADINNDLYPDVISLDMLPEDPVILKRSEGEDALDIFKFKLGYGYNHQYAKNALQLNYGDNTFKDIAMFAGVHATDWSWSPLIFDFDLDGNKDLFISNGIPKRMNDIDYINFISGNEVQFKIQFDKLQEPDLSVIEKIPEIKINNKFYRSSSNLQFEDIESYIENDEISYSNSAIYADLDNDGDYEIVCNNIDQEAFIYNNMTNPMSSLAVSFDGSEENINGIGAKLIVYQQEKMQLFENFTTRGFQSSMLDEIIIPVFDQTVDSILVIWPDFKFQVIQNISSGSLELKYNDASGSFNYRQLHQSTDYKLKSISKERSLDFEHKENPFVEFNREPLIPHATSNEGPALAIGDLNMDGLDDIFIGSSKRNKAALFIQQNNGTFNNESETFLSIDSTYEEVDAVVLDYNNNGINDLMIASGGNEYRISNAYNMPLALEFDDSSNSLKAINLFDSIRTTASCILPSDFNNDGFTDLFIGGRAVPRSYGEVPQSFLLLNDGEGSYNDVSNEWFEELSHIGFVKNGAWADIDGDDDDDLILAMEWDAIKILINEGTTFNEMNISDHFGWWNFVLPFDADNDGDLDILAGNLGLNSRLKASKEEPIKMYFADFDDNGTKEQILTYYSKGKEIPFSNKMELQKQLPILKKKFIYAEDFAKANIEEIFTSEKLATSQQFLANCFENMLFINNGNNTFDAVALPAETQLTSYYDAISEDLNGDGLQDLFLGGNFYDCNIQMGRYDCDFGSLLINKGNNNFEYVQPGGDKIKDQVKSIKPINLADGTTALVIARNSAPLELIQIVSNTQED